MKSNKCPSCKNSISEKAIFCGKCGVQLKCISCKHQISLQHRYCEECGTEIGGTNKKSVASNIFEFEETKENRSIKASFTDTAVKDMSQTLGSFLTTRSIGISQKSIIDEKSINSNRDEEIIDIESLDDTSIEIDDSGHSLIKNRNTGLPNLKNIVYKRLPNSESEWMLIYACYSTNFELAPVTPETLKDFYESTGRKTDSTRRNFQTNLNSLVNQGFIEFINDDEFVVTDDGFDKAREILSRTSGSKPKKTKIGTKKKKTNSENKKTTNVKASKSSSRAPAKSIVQEKFNAHHKDKSLKDFFNEKMPGNSSYNRILVIGYYINFILKSPSFSDGNIDYAYRTLKLSNRPKHLRQTITNIKNNYAQIEDADKDGNWRLTRNGEIFVEEELPKK